MKIKKRFFFLLIVGAGLVFLCSGGLTQAAEAKWDEVMTNLENFGLPSGTISGIISNLVKWILTVFGFIGILGFIVSGIMYLTAAGSEDQISKAKSAMKWSLVGVVVGLVGLVILYAVTSFLSPAGMPLV